MLALTLGTQLLQFGSWRLLCQRKSPSLLHPLSLVRLRVPNDLNRRYNFWLTWDWIIMVEWPRPIPTAKKYKIILLVLINCVPKAMNPWTSKSKRLPRISVRHLPNLFEIFSIGNEIPKPVACWILEIILKSLNSTSYQWNYWNKFLVQTKGQLQIKWQISLH